MENLKENVAKYLNVQLLVGMLLLPDVDGLGALELELNDCFVGQPSTLNMRIIATRGLAEAVNLSVRAADLYKKEENKNTHVLIKNA